MAISSGVVMSPNQREFLIKSNDGQLARPQELLPAHVLTLNRRLSQLFNKGRFDELLQTVDSVEPFTPEYTLCRAWELVTAGQINDTLRLNRLTDYDSLIIRLKA